MNLNEIEENKRITAEENQISLEEYEMILQQQISQKTKEELKIKKILDEWKMVYLQTLPHSPQRFEQKKKLLRLKMEYGLSNLAIVFDENGNIQE